MLAHTQRAGMLAAALTLSACGGSGAGVAGSWGLWCESARPAAGLQWSSSSADLWPELDVMRGYARAALGDAAQVIVRPASATPGNVSRDWMVFAAPSPGQTRWLVVVVNRDPTTVRAAIGDVMCADSNGNPVACALTWKRV